jgi:hyperosmotically inducible protein
VVKERAGDAAVQAKNVLEDGALTAKIKSKITLDDTLEGISINIDTVARVTTLNGTVRSEAQRQRLLQLARETKGVTKVVDNLKVV